MSVPENVSGFEPIALDFILAALRRRMWTIAFCTLAGATVGVAYVALTSPLYTSSTDIMIDKGTSGVIGSVSMATDVFQDDADMMTQVQILSSQQLATSVAQDARLTDDPAFMNSDPSVFSRIQSGVTGILQTVLPFVSFGTDDEELSPEAKLAYATAVLRNNLTVERVDKTYVLRLSYTDSDRTLASKIAQAYGAAYLNDQLEAKYEATRRAAGWLEERLAELRQQSFNADLAVQNYRRDNRLLSTNNQLLSEQQLGGLNTQLIEARASTAEAKARLDQIRSIIASGQPDAVVGDALQNATIVNLRQRYLDAMRRRDLIVQSLGENHLQAQRLAEEMKGYQAQILGELRRIAESYESTYNVALRREESLDASLQGAVGVNATANTSSVQLRELEREADAFRNLYNVFLQRYQETLQEKSFPITEARIITPARMPSRPSFPKVPIVLALATILGAASGIGLAAIREHRDRFFRTGSQVRLELGVEFLGATSALQSPDPVEDVMSQGGEFRAGLWRIGSLNDHSARAPLTPFAETLRNAKFAADTVMGTRQTKVIGVVSCLPREGKTTISANFATLLASRGSRVLLIDADLRNPGLSRTLNIKPNVGLVEAVQGTARLEDCLVWDRSGELAVLPVALGRSVLHSSDVLLSSGMSRIFEQFHGGFDYIIIDLPPLGPIVDARAMVQKVDGLVMVVEWGATSRKLVRTILSDNPGLHDKVLGVIFNKADEKKMQLYRTSDSSDYYINSYKDYYHQ
ncbi:polysaccharide biosynthesis tyrosine autokinase [Aureimonas phyllosphaerae]|uniref:polysaccharide biosynthesis tyrosine autokinase n=1 Tax=Aureimonas phyllosphaerae TaxID=1166078 RepID=UPI003A5C3583